MRDKLLRIINHYKIDRQLKRMENEKDEHNK